MHRLRTDVFAHLQRQSLGFFTRTRTGEVQSRITNDIGGMQSVVTSTATSIASNLTTAVATAVAMVALSWRLSLISLRRAAAGDLADPPGRADAPRRSPPQRQRELADLNVTVEEGLSISGVQLQPDHSAPAPPWSTASPRPRPASSTWSCARSWPAAGGWPR